MRGDYNESAFGLITHNRKQISVKIRKNKYLQ